MSDRLRDQTQATDPAVRRAARWLASVGPAESSKEALSRVRARLTPKRARRPLRRGPLLVVAVAAVVLALLAVAAAMVAGKLDLWGPAISGHAIIIERPLHRAPKTHHRTPPTHKNQPHDAR